MNKILLLASFVSTLVAFGQNKLDATATRFFDDQGNVVSQDSLKYNYDNFQLYTVDDFKPKLNFEEGVYYVTFADKSPNFSTAEVYTSIPFQLQNNLSSTYVNENVVETLETANGNITGKTEYQYDMNGNLTNQSFFFFDGTNYLINNGTNYSYDANGNLIEIVNFFSNNSTIENDAVDSIFYDVNNNPTTYLSYFLNNGVLELGNKTVTSYNNNTPTITYLLEENNGSLDSVFRLEYTFINNNLTLLEGFPYVGNGFSSFATGSFVYTYNTQGNLTLEEILFAGNVETTEYEYNQDNQVTKITNAGNFGGTLEINQITDYYFQSVASLIENNAISVSIFPNPTSDILTIQTQEEVKSIKIYNVNGKLVLKQKENSVNLDNFEGGTYTVLVETQNGIAQKTFVKK